MVERRDHFWVSTLLCATDVRSEQEVGVYDNIYATNLNQRDANPNSVHLSNGTSLGALYEILSVFKEIRR